jgi:signal transduction histidine kinase
VNNKIVDSWNETLNVIAKVCNVPVALVMKLDNGEISAFSKNDDANNPYTIGESETLQGSGLYCEYVINNQKELNVSNALKDPNWNDNPDLKLNMISYFGLPLSDADGSPFGTLCILDSAERVFPQETLDLLDSLKKGFEAQLKEISNQHLRDEKEYYSSLLELTVGLTHEINTPLSIAITSSSIIEDQIEQLKLACTCSSDVAFAKLQSAIDLLTNNLALATQKIDQLQESYVGECTNPKVKCNVVELCKEVFEVYVSHAMKEKGITHKINFQRCNEQEIFIRSAQLRKVIIELVQNSIAHAFTPINTAPSIKIELVSCDAYLEIHYRDNGVGISIESKDRIFAPYYTTQRSNKKTGLGLSVVKKIILQQLEAKIQLIPTETGVYFIIRIPIPQD